MGKGSKAPQEVKTVQNNDPWAGAQPALTTLMTNAQSAYAATPKTAASLYAGPTDQMRQMASAAPDGTFAGALGGIVTTPNADTMAGLADILQKTQRYSYGAEQTRGLADDTIAGKYLRADSNPYLADYIALAGRGAQTAYDQNMLTIGDAAQRMGAYGGDREGISRGVALKGLQETLGGIGTNIAFANYDAERNRQMQAPSLYGQATALDQSRDQGAMSVLQAQEAVRNAAQEQAIRVAQMQEEQRRAQLAEQFSMQQLQQQWAQQQLDAVNAAPWAGMSNLSAALGVASPYGTQTKIVPGMPGQSGAAGALQGALGGAAAGSAFGPWGAGIGAIAGGLGSFL